VFGFNSANRVIAVFVGLWVSLSFGLLAMSCSDEEPSREQADLAQGQDALARGEIAAAAEHFRQGVRAAPADPQAALAYATARTLGIPDCPQARQAITLTGGALVSWEPLLYGPDGLLALLAAGRSPEQAWEELRERAPWPTTALRSPEDFLRALPADLRLAALGDACVELGEELRDVATWFEAAAQDPQVRMVVPRSVLHLRDDLVVGAAEAQLAAGLLRVGQASLLVAAAWLEDERPLMLTGLDAQGLAGELNERLLGGTPNGHRLAAARRSFDLGLDGLKRALEPGTAGNASPAGSVALAWGRLGQQERAGLLQLVEALRGALYVGALLPESEPRTMVQLNECFEAPYWPLGLGVPLIVSAVDRSVPDAQGELALSSRFLERLAQPLTVPSIRRADEPGSPWTIPSVSVHGAPVTELLAEWLEPLHASLLGG